MNEFNPLVQRVDALLKRHQQQVAPALAEPEPGYVPESASAGPAPGPEDDIPVLTEVVEPAESPAPPAAPLTEALVAQIEGAVLEKVLAAFEGTLAERLGRTVSDLVAQAADGLRADLSASIRDMARDAVAAAVKQELAERSRRG